MPLVRIDLPKGSSLGRRRAIADVVYEAMRQHLKVPEDDRFQIITEHDEGSLVIDPSYLGIARSKAALIIQITLSEGRSVEMKQAFYRAVAEDLKAKVDQRPEDVTINLVEVKKENWSFGNGIAAYVDKP
jgi:4-oxalocrotonate tautomerase